MILLLSFCLLLFSFPHAQYKKNGIKSKCFFLDFAGKFLHIAACNRKHDLRLQCGGELSAFFGQGLIFSSILAFTSFKPYCGQWGNKSGPPLCASLSTDAVEYSKILEKLRRTGFKIS
jgi:hypothetical protein